MAANYFATGIAPKRMGSAHPNIVPYQCFKARDGKYLTVAVGNDRIWKNFCEALGLENLAENPKFATNPKRVENKVKLIPLLEKAFLNKTRDEWIEILLKKGVPCGPIYVIDEVFRDPQIQHRKMLVEIEHPKIGKIKQIGIPMKFSETPGEIRKPPPLLGQHTREILKNLLGYSEEEIKQLEREEII
jgi:crotonobetainyl-CoA:carnitine CoA-transferase CaiB-like acyl-CoA transferase